MRESSTPVSVTVCAVFQFVAVKVSDDADTVPSPVSELATPSTTSPVGSLDSFTVNVAVPPSSVVRSRDDDDVAGDTANPAVSSSVSVSSPPAGADTPLPPETAPRTITCLSGASTSLSFAVTVTAPVLVVSPAAIVRVFALDRLKSAATTPGPAAVPTVTVTASLDAPDSVAVTVETPPFSEIDDEDSASVTVGSVSSSVSVSGAPVTLPVPWSLAAAAVTVVERPPPPWCVASFTAVMVAVSVAFAVSPAAIAIVASEPTV